MTTMWNKEMEMRYEVPDVRMRKSNGVCEYGDWIVYKDAPIALQQAIDEVMIEDAQASGELIVGGQRWHWEA